MVEIIPKEVSKPSKVLKIMLYFAIFLLLLSTAGYFVMNNFLDKAKNNLASIESEISQVMTPEKVTLEREVLFSKGEIDRFANLVNQHLETSAIFGIVQRVTHPKVWFSKFDLDSRQKTFQLTGETENFESLGQQVLIMRNEEAISIINLDTVSTTRDGRVGFVLSLALKSNAF